MARSTDSSRAVGIKRQPGLSVLTFFLPILSLDVLDLLSSILETLSEENARDPLVLCSALGSAMARAALLEARDLDPISLSLHGAILRTTEDPFATAIETARRLASLDPTRRRLWRALRGPGFIDRFHAFVVHKL